jgi:hypothetical protein
MTDADYAARRADLETALGAALDEVDAAEAKEREAIAAARATGLSLLSTPERRTRKQQAAFEAKRAASEAVRSATAKAYAIAQAFTDLAASRPVAVGEDKPGEW